MNLTLHVPPGGGKGLCDIDSLNSRKIQKNIKKGCPGTTK